MITRSSRVFDPGFFQLPNHSHKYRNWNRNGDGWVDMELAIARSNDTYFYDLANRLGIDRLHQYMSAYGFGQRVALDMYEETGGLMPSADTLLHFQDVISIEQRWLLSGTHYEKTANAWLQNQDNNREQVMRVLQGVYGMADAAVWYQRWRMFWMACAELFGFDNGNEWMVAHYRFKR